MVNFKDMRTEKKTKLHSLRNLMELAAVKRAFDEEGTTLDQPSFKRLLRTLIHDANIDAIKHGRRKIPVPSSKELDAAFGLADTDGNGIVDEQEFLVFYKLTVEGRLPEAVKGRASGGFKLYSRPTQIRLWGEHETHPNQDWQDLFFGGSPCLALPSTSAWSALPYHHHPLRTDLLFVAGAFKVGNFLVDSLVYNPHQFDAGLQWFFVVFMVIAQQWFMKLNIQARFSFHSFFHGTIFETIEFSTIALAIWNVPGAYIYVDVADVEDSSYSSSYASRRLAELGTGAQLEKLSTTDQLRYNVQSQSFAFSLFIAINNALHIFKWCEVLNMDAITSGAQTIARFMVAVYTVVFFIFASGCYVTYNVSGDDHESSGSDTCIYFWLAGVVVYFVCFQAWYAPL